MVEYISPAPAVILSVVESIAPTPAVFQAPEPVVESIAPAPTVFRAPAPVVEYLAPALAVFQAPTPVVEFFLHPCPQLFKRQREWWSTLLPRQKRSLRLLRSTSHPCRLLTLRLHLSWNSSRLQSIHSFSLLPASSDTETHFPIVTVTSRRKGIETPTSSLLRRRPVDESGHVLDVQVERVTRASVARLGYEWRRTKGREKQLAGTLLHLSRELQSCPCRGHTVTLLGLLAGSRGPIPAPSAIAGVVSGEGRGRGGGLLGARCRVPRTGNSGAGAAGF